jgi:eukaryotic-like serine/threonine-protein kinase
VAEGVTSFRLLSPEHERRIIDELVSRGQLSPEAVARADAALATWGSRLGALLAAGSLDDDTLARLLADSDGETPMPGPFDAPTPHPSSPTPRVLPAVGTTAPPVEPTVTQMSGSEPEEAPASPVRAGRRIGHYVLGPSLGRGGMGEVFSAEDTVLGRRVAVKLLFSDEPGQADRFLQEARLQARVRHEHVCPVYEAGMQDGVPFIVMRLVEGLTLSRAHLVMSAEQKVRVMLRVAEAVHAAHTLGLIHRDLKPSNIMVELAATGDWQPFVTDFGLAREISGHGADLTGQAVGTPAFMSPEQALGLKTHQDARTDVYGLGATLYYLLAGRPPIEAENPLLVLRRVVDTEPVPLRRQDPTVSADLETIVMKCLEKEQERRYPTAHDLAEDLRRYLEGEPISARAVSLPYRFWKFARRNRTEVAVSTAAGVAILVLSALSIRSNLNAAEQARLARAFGQDAERVEAAMRTAHLLPEHDIRPEKARVQAMMERITAERRAVGMAAEGPAEYALGRGCMALGRFSEAREHLEKAWAEGMTGPEASSALGLTLGYLYRERLEETMRIADPRHREAERRLLEVDYRTPAVACLRAGLAVMPSEYGEGLVALFERRFADAVARAQAAFAKDTALYEARLLEGEARLGIAQESRRRGEHAAAMAELGRARQAFEAAAGIARSDPACHAALGELWVRVVQADLASGGDLPAHLARGLDAAGAALRIDPGRAESLVVLARLRSMEAQYRLGHGDDPTAALAAAANAAGQALALRPSWLEPAFQAATALHLRAAHELASGRDPRGALVQAVDAYQKVLKIDPRHMIALANLGAAEESLGMYLAGHGGDPRASFTAAISYLGRATQEDPTDATAWSNLGGAHVLAAEHEREHGADTREALGIAIGCLERAVAAQPGLVDAMVNLGAAYAARAQVRLARGEDPAGDLASARTNLEAAVRVNSDLATAHAELGNLERVTGELHVLQGADPADDWRRSRSELTQALAIAGGGTATRLDLVALHLAEAAAALEAGHTCAGELAEARRQLEAAESVDPDLVRVDVARGSVELLGARSRPAGTSSTGLATARAAFQAAIDTDAGQVAALLGMAETAAVAAEGPPEDPAAATAGLAWAERALAASKGAAEAHRLRGRLLVVLAAAEPARRRELAAEAVAALEDSLAANHLAAARVNPLLARARRLAE